MILEIIEHSIVVCYTWCDTIYSNQNGLQSGKLEVEHKALISEIADLRQLLENKRQVLQVNLLNLIQFNTII